MKEEQARKFIDLYGMVAYQNFSDDHSIMGLPLDEFFRSILTKFIEINKDDNCIVEAFKKMKYETMGPVDRLEANLEMYTAEYIKPYEDEAEILHTELSPENCSELSNETFNKKMIRYSYLGKRIKELKILNGDGRSDVLILQMKRALKCSSGAAVGEEHLMTEKMVCAMIDTVAWMYRLLNEILVGWLGEVER